MLAPANNRAPTAAFARNLIVVTPFDRHPATKFRRGRGTSRAGNLRHVLVVMAAAAAATAAGMRTAAHVAAAAAEVATATEMRAAAEVGTSAEMRATEMADAGTTV